MRKRIASLFGLPLIRRIGWHLRRVTGQMEASFYRKLLLGLVAVLGLSALAVMFLEQEPSIFSFFSTFYWALTTVIGQGNADFVTSPGGWVVSWLLNLFGVGIVATVTGALVGFVIDLLLKEGQGMGAAGFNEHVVVCGWNATARDLIEELKTDDYGVRVVLIDGADRNPAGDAVYFVRGDGANDDDLKRANIQSAKAAIICPRDGSDDADMHSILTVLAIEHIAPEVRTVVEVNNPKHVPHFRRAEVDEVLVTSKLASRLLARTALYPGLGDLVTDMVSGGEGSEIYRVRIPDRMAGLSVLDSSRQLKQENGATLLAIARDDKIMTNPGPHVTLRLGDEIVVMAEDLERLASLSSDEGEKVGGPGS